MSLKNTVSAGGLAMALSIGGLGLALQGCATTGAAKSGAHAAKGGEKSCGAGSCSGEKAAKGGEKSCGEKADKGGEKSCGEGSCG
jgi:uncharacterized low-complexity protein